VSEANNDVLSSPLSRRNAWLGALFFFLAALFLRLGGIGWGLPTEYRHQSLHPDELLIKEWADNRPYFRPGFYNYGTLYLTALKAGADMGRSYGWVREGEGVAQWQTDRDIHLTGRVISCIAGALAVAFVFATVLCFAGVLGAALAAFAMAFAPGHVVHSRFQTSDVLATMLIAAAVFFAVRLATSEGNRRSDMLACAVAIGLAAGTKYTGILLLLPLILLLGWSGQRRWIIPAILVTACAFVFATPGILLESDRFWSGFTYELAHSAAGHGIVFASTPSGFIVHLNNLMEAFGVLALLSGISGLAWAITHKHRWALAMAVFFLLYYFVIGRAEVKFLRYVFPLLPLLAIGVGYAVAEAHKRGGWMRVVPAVALLAIGFSLAMRQGAMPLTALMQIKDPRDQTASWLNEKHPKETIGFVSDPWFYSPPLFPNTGLLSPDARLEAMIAFMAQVRFIRYIAPDGSRKDWDTRLITGWKPDYIVFSSFEFLDNDRTNQPDFVAFIELMTKEYKPAAVFWGPAPSFPSEKEANGEVTRAMIRSLFTSRFPLTHDMMYIQPTICLFAKRTPN